MQRDMQTEPEYKIILVQRRRLSGDNPNESWSEILSMVFQAQRRLDSGFVQKLLTLLGEYGLTAENS
jgi:hypothetical protein